MKKIKSIIKVISDDLLWAMRQAAVSSAAVCTQVYGFQSLTRSTSKSRRGKWQELLQRMQHKDRLGDGSKQCAPTCINTRKASTFFPLSDTSSIDYNRQFEWEAGSSTLPAPLFNKGNSKHRLNPKRGRGGLCLSEEHGIKISLVYVQTRSISICKCDM